MHIESGTTKWWRNRHLMFLALFVGAAAWFAYDGFYAYPAENKKWAAQAMGVAPDSFEVIPSLTRPAIQQFAREFQGKGITLDDLRARFGKETHAGESGIWFVGPDAYLKVAIKPEGPVLEPPGLATHELTSMKMQKYFAAGLLAAALLMVVKLVRVMTTRIVLDDAGFAYNNRRIAWEEMTGLRGEDYARKGWADLEYTRDGAKRTFRLDSYHIEKFDEIVTAICERKGFASPLAAASSEAGPGPGGFPTASP